MCCQGNRHLCAVVKLGVKTAQEAEAERGG
jgi:hypothetical protein